jgi:uncharacterized membrane protein
MKERLRPFALLAALSGYRTVVHFGAWKIGLHKIPAVKVNVEDMRLLSLWAFRSVISGEMVITCLREEAVQVQHFLPGWWISNKPG